MYRETIEKVKGTGGVDCLLVDKRYLIYLDDGTVYDTLCNMDIPEHILYIKDIALKILEVIK